MLSKREIMSVGTIVRIRYENDGKDTLAVSLCVIKKQ